MVTGTFCEGNPICAAGCMWCSTPVFLSALFCWSVLWCGIFYSVAWILHPALGGCLQRRWPSEKPKEEDSYWLANHITSTVHAVLVSCMVLPAWIEFLSAPPQAQFSQPAVEYEEWIGSAALALNATLIFVSYIIFDLVVGFVHGLHVQGNAIHHVVFIGAGVMGMYNCFMGFISATLLLMETSTIFLNYFSFFRYRFGYSALSVRVAMGLFGCFFFFFRIVCLFGILGYLGNLLWIGGLRFEGTPMWNVAILYSGLCAGFVLQLFWLSKIVSILSAKLRVREPVATDEVSSEPIAKNEAGLLKRLVPSAEGPQGTPQ